MGEWVKRHLCPRSKSEGSSNDKFRLPIHRSPITTYSPIPPFTHSPIHLFTHKEDNIAITVSRSRVKEKCGIADSDYDTPIDNLILELVPVISYFIRDEHINDTSNSGLQATLTLAATEVLCGEFAAQLLRTPGNGDIAKIAGLTIEPFGLSRPGDPTGLAGQGWTRLKPFLKSEASLRIPSTTIAVAPRPGGP
jgi:hypothetical protein